MDGEERRACDKILSEREQRQQHPIGDFVLDFYCTQIRLAIDIDGPVHAERGRYDEGRDAQLGDPGIRVWRIPDNEAARRMPETMCVLWDEAKRRSGTAG